jgi:hypothetical protein
LRWFLLLGVVACSSSEPAPAAPSVPSAPPAKAAPPAAPAPACTAEALGLKHGPEIGEYAGTFLGNNALKLRFAQLEGTAPGEPPKPGTGFVAWGEIKLGNVEPLFELKATDVPDPGVLCVATVSAAGQPRPGKLIPGNRPGNFPEMTVTGRVSADAATALWGAGALQAGPDGDKLVPGFDALPDGGSYVLVHLGDLGPQGNPVELTLGGRLFGEVSLAIVNGKGRAIQHITHVQ